MGSRGAITLSIPPARVSLPSPPRRPVSAPSHPLATLGLSFSARIDRETRVGPLFLDRENQRDKSGERASPVFLRSPVPLILILLHIAGQIAGKCA